MTMKTKIYIQIALLTLKERFLQIAQHMYGEFAHTLSGLKEGA